MALFTRIAYVLRNSRMLSLVRLTVYPTPREMALATIFEFLKLSRKPIDVKDYFEFGVFRGKTFSHVYHLAHRAGFTDMRFFAFDSFQGLPAVVGSDDGSVFKEGDYAFCLDDFKTELRKNRVNLNRCTVIDGWFKDTCVGQTQKNLQTRGASMIYIDSDLYESTIPVLDFIVDLVETGTVVVFDDWYCFNSDPDRGQQKAVREWLAKNKNISLNDFMNVGAHGKVFIVKLLNA